MLINVTQPTLNKLQSWWGVGSSSYFSCNNAVLNPSDSACSRGEGVFHHSQNSGGRHTGDIAAAFLSCPRRTLATAAVDVLLAVGHPSMGLAWCCQF